MPRTKEELRAEWKWMIINDINLEDRKKELNSKYKINDLNDEINTFVMLPGSICRL